jgi:glyoxylase-like metal-dependent hydrolase (beta-lactamase superfamily II)
MEIAKGVWLISLPGHTWGTMGMAVRLAHTGWVLMPSDALYHHTNYGDPFVSGILNHDQERWAQSALKIRKLAETYDMTILPGHDDTSIVRPRAKAGEHAPVQAVYE